MNLDRQNNSSALNYKNNLPVNANEIITEAEIYQNVIDKIILIGEGLPSKDSEPILMQYVNIVEMTKKVNKELESLPAYNHLRYKTVDKEYHEDLSTIDNATEEECMLAAVEAQLDDYERHDKVVKNISENILEKANSLLTALADRVEKGEKIDHEELMQKLKDYDEELLFTFSTLKALRGELKIDDLKGVRFERISIEKYAGIKEQILQMANGAFVPNEKDDEDLKEVYGMFELYKKNYAGREKFLKDLLTGFAKVLTADNGKTHLYLVKKGDHVIAFNRFDKKSETEKYFGSCNVLPSVQGSAIGRAVFERSIAEESPGFEMNATVDAFSPISSTYIERGNFQVEQIDTESDPDGIFWFVLKREKDEERKGCYVGEAGGDLIQEYKLQDKEIEKLIKCPQFILCFDKSKEQRELIVRLVNKEKYKITRNYFDKESKRTYLGFEKK